MRTVARLALVAIVISGLIGGATNLPSRTAQGQTTIGEADLAIWRVKVSSPAEVSRLTSGGWDVLEGRGDDYLLVMGDSATARELEAQGFTVSVDQLLPSERPDGLFSYYGGYRTVVEHYQHLDALAAAYPDLVSVVDYGDSWRKLQNAASGYDLKAICITYKRAGDCAQNPATDKPRFVLMAAIHARELSTSEQAWRWMDFLVSRYGVDADITALLDHNEMWIIPVVNPDGREIVESGPTTPYTQRKNANTSLGSCSNPPTGSSQYGIDLNRNADFQWGGAGTSTSPCSLVYRGTSGASEPENYYLQNFLSSLFPDQRGPALSDAAPQTTTGTFITLHSYSNLVLLPWGWVECNSSACPPSQQSPNDAGLRSLAFRMSYFNGYNTGQPSEILYAASGGTDDWAYGVLGVASFTFEVGPGSGTCSGFMPAYTCQDSTFWPKNRDALIYAAKSARQPYTLSLGPSTITPTLSLTTTVVGTPITVTAPINDGTYGAIGINRPASQAIAAAEYYLDTPPWAGGAALPMAAQDGTFNSTSEVVSAQIDTTGLSVGRHTVFVRGRDDAGNWGPTTASWITVVADPSSYVYMPLIIN
ncbi:MAG: hypothetical protein H0T53_08520 [Herpetosiphonaceae bacterium]|nr:hypothetical protein [Herpetosiphonaceae bacterium]